MFHTFLIPGSTIPVFLVPEILCSESVPEIPFFLVPFFLFCMISLILWQFSHTFFRLSPGFSFHCFSFSFTGLILLLWIQFHEFSCSLCSLHFSQLLRSLLLSGSALISSTFTWVNTFLPSHFVLVEVFALPAHWQARHRTQEVPMPPNAWFVCWTAICLPLRFQKSAITGMNSYLGWKFG